LGVCPSVKICSCCCNACGEDIHDDEKVLLRFQNLPLCSVYVRNNFGKFSESSCVVTCYCYRNSWWGAKMLTILCIF
jgi:hypothetical protein